MTVMPHIVYILYSKKDRRLYTGCTSDIVQRLKDHETGKVYATRNRRPLVLIHAEEYPDKGEAFQRERFLKSLWAGRFKKKILSEYLGRAKPYPLMRIGSPEHPRPQRGRVF